MELVDFLERDPDDKKVLKKWVSPFRLTSRLSWSSVKNTVLFVKIENTKKYYI